ncbi:MAG TPA: histidine kinase [Streptosporangiaceae bacterium]|nr:histidine kinase [Streptosporangiaceae bacterium]
MNLTGYVEALQQQLAVAAATGGDETQALASRLVAPLDAATRLVLLDALSAAAGEITREMAPGSVDLRLRGQEPSFVVTLPPAEPVTDDTPAPADAAPPAPAPEADDAAMVRINLRLPEHLKGRVEDAASQAGLSVNAWLVRAAATALNGPGEQNTRSSRDDRRAPRGGQRFTGWVR